MSFDPPTSEDFRVRVNNGEIPGYSYAVAIGYKPSMNTTFEMVWSGGGNMTDPTTAETYEVVSTSANDTLLGTGTRTLLIQSLDASGLIQSNLVNMNGTTPATVPGTHTFPRQMLGVNSGTLKTNAGEITLRVAGGGDVRAHMMVGDSNQLSSSYKTPANKAFHLIGLDYHSGGVAKAVEIKSQVMIPGTNTWVTTSRLPSFQQSFEKTFSISAKYDPGTMIRYLARIVSGSGANDSLGVILLGYEVDI